MTTTPDLTAERLEELEREVPEHRLCACFPERDMLALIAMARAKQAAVEERDALRKLMRLAVVFIMFDDPWCRSCERDTEDDGHADSCPVPRMMAALAQPTLPTGAASRDAGGV